MKIMITNLLPPHWEVRDAYTQDVQKLVKFAEQWSGVKIEAQDEAGHYVIKGRNEAEADAFDSRFQDDIVRAP